MARDTEGWDRPNSRAALEKLPLSTARTNNASCCSRSFMRQLNISYRPPRNTLRRFALPTSRRSKPSGAESRPAGGMMRSMTMGELSGKVAIVTGASKGIGAAIARRFAEAGAAVAVNYASRQGRRGPGGRRDRRQGRQGGRDPGGRRKSADVKRLFAETKAKLGAPSILVNNAGVFSFAPLEAVTEEDYRPPVRHQCSGHAARDQASGRAPSTARAAASSISARSRASIRCRTRSSIRPRRRRSTRSPGRWPRTCAEEHPRQRDRAGNDRNRGPEDDGIDDGGRQGDGHGHADGPAWASPTISPGWRCSLPPTSRRG